MPDVRPGLFVELCCGSAAVTLKLLGGKYARPPISYMGSKAGYAHAVLAAMGLRMGVGADRVLLCDAGPWSQVWGVLADPERCAEVARILRSWSDEDPRALWERLRDEHRGEWDGWTAERAAGWIACSALSRQSAMNSFRGKHPYYENMRGWYPEPPEIARRVESVAAWLQCGAWSYEQGNQKTGFVGPGDRRQDTTATATATATERTAQMATSQARFQVIAGPAEDIEPPEDCAGVVLYCDPPYQGTTGYAAKMPRETVLAVARRWSDAGALVCVSEAVPLPLDGWHHVEITDARKGQRRTFSRQQTEWLTMNREPAEVPCVQEVLF